MKQIKQYIILSIAFSILLLQSCEGDGMLPHDGMLSIGGAPSFVLNTDKSTFIDLGALNSTDIEFELGIGQGEITSMDIMVVWSGDQGFNPGILEANLSTFPSTKNISWSVIKTALNITDGDVEIGHTFTIFANLTLSNGTELKGRDANGPLYSQNEQNNPLYTIELTFPVVCPPNFSQFAGTWSYDDPFHPYEGRQVEISVGPGTNQITLHDLQDDGFDVVADVDPTSGNLTIAQQNAWDTAIYGLPYGNAFITGHGISFTCIGEISLSIDSQCVAIGCFGGTPYTATLTKN